MKNRLISKLVLLLVTMAIVLIALQTYASRNSSINYSLKKAESISEIVQSGLTAHMINDTMDKRKAFLNSIANTKSIDNIWIVRGTNVEKQFGKSTFPEDTPHDQIDLDVLETGQMKYNVIEDFSNAKLRVTIPYKATINNQINCLDCHNVQRGDTLGAVSITLDISDFKSEGIFKLLSIIIITFIAIIALLIIINRMISPYMKTLDLLQRKLHYASKGEFKFLNTSIDKDEKEINELINSVTTHPPYFTLINPNKIHQKTHQNIS